MPPKIYFHWVKTRFGLFQLAATSRGLYSLAFAGTRRFHSASGSKPLSPRIRSLFKKAASQIRAYLAGKGVSFRNLPVDWNGYGAFEKKVFRELQKIRRGKTESYQFLARKAGRTHAPRWVGRILQFNRLPLIIPCHRIVLKNGGLGGFSQGLRWKKRLLKLETHGVDIKGEPRLRRSEAL